MALSRQHTFVTGETLTASLLNAEFDNILNNAGSLISPLPSGLDLNGQILTIDADADSTLREYSDDVVVFRLQGFDALILDGDVATPVNGITFTSAATGVAPALTAHGETNVALALAGKGTGAVQLGQATSVGVTLMADQPLLDSSANELLKFTKTASAINELTIANAAIGTAPVISATGGDTNIGITLAPKGTGAVTIVSTDAGAAEGPSLDLYRNSASPTANDIIGAVNFQGEDDAGNTQTYAKLLAQIIDPANTGPSENAALILQTVEAGVVATRLTVGGAGGGIQVGAPTGTDKGAGTLNIDGSASLHGLYLDGAPVGAKLLATLTASTSASLDFTATNATLYSGYLFVFDQYLPATATSDMYFRVSTDGGSNFVTGSGYAYIYMVKGVGSSTDVSSASDSKIIIINNLSATTTAGWSGWMLVSTGQGANGCKVNWQLAGFTHTTSFGTLTGGGLNNSGAVNAFRLLQSSGNIASGVIYVYGIPKV